MSTTAVFRQTSPSAEGRCLLGPLERNTPDGSLAAHKTVCTDGHISRLLILPMPLLRLPPLLPLIHHPTYAVSVLVGQNSYNLCRTSLLVLLLPSSQHYRDRLWSIHSTLPLKSAAMGHETYAIVLIPYGVTPVAIDGGKHHEHLDIIARSLRRPVSCRMPGKPRHTQHAFYS